MLTEQWKNLLTVLLKKVLTEVLKKVLDFYNDALRSYHSSYLDAEKACLERCLLLSVPCMIDKIGLNTYLTTREVSLLAGLPQKEIPGIVVKEGVEFGLNYLQDEEGIVLGKLVQKGRILKDMPVNIKRNVLNKHVFIAGVTGSGKTTTCHRLLQEAECPFLVIEPAKTEYRAMIDSAKYDNVIVFTAGDEETAPLRINPFELVKGENVSAHIDMIKATFTSAFPMEASMPQILEEALYKCYEDKGWNIDTNINEFESEEQEKEYNDKRGRENTRFPIMSDLLDSLDEIVSSKKFSKRLEDDYRGSLISRFSNLTKGAKGAMFNCQSSVDFEEILEKNVIIEMENMKSAEDKALLMGFILARVSDVIKNKHRDNKEFRHLTLVEEAHRLLAKIQYGDNGSKRNAVETFTDLLAEVRKYGEGLIIVDQIPSKLAPEVLKNTNTKIIHKLFALDDKEAVGDTMLID